MTFPKLFVFLVSVCVTETQLATNLEISSILKELTQRLELTEAQVKDLKLENEGLKTELQSVTQGLKTAVAFSATLQTTQPHEFIGPYDSDYTVKYENVITNVGSAYDPSTGMFTVPVKGVYFFTFVIFKPVGHSMTSPSGAMLKKNGEMVVSATDNVPKGDDTEDTTTNSVTLELDVSDKVYIEMHAGRHLYTDANRRNSFSGHLLYTM